MNVTIELERRLLGAIGGFMGLTSHVPDIAKSVFRAAEIPEEEVDAALKAHASDRFIATMWNREEAARLNRGGAVGHGRKPS